MNCANHPGIAAVAYCRTCGKPLCDSCKRDVMGVIYCEQCLADRLRDVHPNNVTPTPGFVAPATVGTAAPHPAVAGILAGFFPFGVGAVYTGQYAKALVHLGIFVALIWALSGHMGGMEPVFGIGLSFFVVYQIVDAVRSAHAIRLGQPPPDPFGFNRAFGSADRATVADVPANTALGTVPLGVREDHVSAKAPTTAVVLIVLGVLFLLHTAGVFEFNVDRIWPLFLIGLGVWLFISRSGMLAPGYDPSRGFGRRVWSGPVWLITIGALFLIQSFDGPGLGRTWPVLLLVVGLMKLMSNRVPPAVSGPPPVVGFQPPPTVPPAPTPEGRSSNEVKNG